MDHSQDAFAYFRGGYRCMHALIGQPDLTVQPIETEQAFHKRILHSQSPTELKRTLNYHIENENYEFCCIIRDVAIERRITLI